MIVLRRRPRNTLGWLMLAMGLGFAVPFQSYGNYAIAKGSLPLGPEMLALSGPSWIWFIGISGFLLMLFPDGHLPTRRWRWFAWMCFAGLAMLFLGIVTLRRAHDRAAASRRSRIRSGSPRCRRRVATSSSCSRRSPWSAARSPSCDVCAGAPIRWSASSCDGWRGRRGSSRRSTCSRSCRRPCSAPSRTYGPTCSAVSRRSASC